MNSAATLNDSYLVPEEERAPLRSKETYTALLRRLSHQSVVKHFDAYGDVPWDDADYRIDPDDSRWEAGDIDPIGITTWYHAQPAGVRSRIGLHMTTSFMKIGAQFECILKRGLLDFATRLPNNSPEFRYVYHEVIEEAQHSLMFQEFVNRSGFDVPGLPAHMRMGGRVVERFARTFPELFFMFVLGGEDPIDYRQRLALRSGREVPPILKRIMQIHVTEEARHLCFARHFLKRQVPQLSAARRLMLSIRTPLVLSNMTPLMMRPSADVIRTYGIPKQVIREAYAENPRHRAENAIAVSKVRDLCGELGLLTPMTIKLWKHLGIWAV